MAAKQFSAKIEGLDAAVKTLLTLNEQAPVAIASLMKAFADTQVVTPAKEQYVPVATGNLRATIRAEEPIITPTRILVRVSAGGPAAAYALNVHENPRAGKTGGVSPSGKKYARTKGGKPTWSTVGQWKYLETPAIAAAKDSAAWLANGARAFLRSLSRKG